MEKARTPNKIRKAATVVALGAGLLTACANEATDTMKHASVEATTTTVEAKKPTAVEYLNSLERETDIRAQIAEITKKGIAECDNSDVSCNLIDLGALGGKSLPGDAKLVVDREDIRLTLYGRANAANTGLSPETVRAVTIESWAKDLPDQAENTPVMAEYRITPGQNGDSADVSSTFGFVRKDGEMDFAAYTADSRGISGSAWSDSSDPNTSSAANQLSVNQTFEEARATDAITKDGFSELFKIGFHR